MDPIDAAGAVAAITGAAAGVAWAGRGALRWARRITHMVDDVMGEPGRPGVPGRPGLMERLSRIEESLCQTERDLRDLREHVGVLSSRLTGVEIELSSGSGRQPA